MSAGGETWRNRPWDITATWSASESASPWSWVTSTAVAPLARSARGDRAAGLLAQPGVERGERLVEQDQGGLGSQRPGERDALLLPTGELVRVPPGDGRRQLDQVEHLA